MGLGLAKPQRFTWHNTHVRAGVHACVRAGVHACVRGCVGAWARGCVGAWVCGCVGVCVYFSSFPPPPPPPEETFFRFGLAGNHKEPPPFAGLPNLKHKHPNGRFSQRPPFGMVLGHQGSNQ